MIASSFAESTHCLGRPDDMTDEECIPLCVADITFGKVPAVVSCWKLSKDEVDEFKRTG